MESRGEGGESKDRGSRGSWKREDCSWVFRRTLLCLCHNTLNKYKKRGGRGGEGIGSQGKGAVAKIGKMGRRREHTLLESTRIKLDVWEKILQGLQVSAHSTKKTFPTLK